MDFTAARDFRSQLRAGKTLIGAWQTLAQPAITEILAMSGPDWLALDLEHSMLDLQDVADSIRVADLMKCPVIVRPPSHDPALIKRLLDAKADGIMAANVRTAEEARSIVAATRYAPKGIRGVGLGRAQGYGDAFEEQLAWANEGALVIVQIEDVQAIEHIDEIFAVDGVDAFFVGPYDLSCSVGTPGDFAGSAFTQALERILDAGSRAGLPAGFHQVEPVPADLGQRISEGYRLVAYGVDFQLLYRGMSDALEDVAALRTHVDREQ